MYKFIVLIDDYKKRYPMIIDSHAHLMSAKFISEQYWDHWLRVFSALSNRPVEIIKKRLPEFWDETGELLIEDMDAAGIDKSWISVLDFGLANSVGEAEYSIREINRLYAEIAQKHSKRFIPFVGVDPRREEAVELLETGVREWGMRGLKLIPATGFYPNDRAFYKLYAKADELGIPVLVHTGPEIIPLYSKYCYPIYLDDIANDYPDLTIIMAHAGFCWWPEALDMAGTKPNLYIDLSGWQPKTLQHPVDEFYAPLRKILDRIGPYRVLFGSDWPAYRLLKSGSATWIKSFTDPPEVVMEAGISFTEDEIDAILGGNASRIVSS